MQNETTSSRRAVLRTAVSGFALATTGLLVPAWLEEAEAREGAYGGKLGGRHGKNRRGRKHHRRNRDHRGHRDDRGRDKRSDRDPPKFSGPAGDLDIKFILRNDAASEIDATCFFYKWNTIDVIGHESKTVPAGGSVEFPTLVPKAAVFFDHDRHTVWAENPLFGFPIVEITSARRGGTGRQGLDEGESMSFQAEGYHIDVKRETDDGRKVFTIRYRK